MNLILQAIKSKFSRLESKINEINSQVGQSDWSVSDETAAGYIKNRTHYSENLYGVFLSNTVETNGWGDPWACFDIETTFVPEIGNEYTVIWDGDSYTVICFEVEGGYILGDGDYGYIGDLPFQLFFHINRTTMMVLASSEGTHTYEVLGTKEIVHKLDAKYLPEVVPTREDVLQLQSAMEDKMNSKNPTGSGSFSINRNPYYPIGSYSVAIGSATVASGNSSCAEGDSTRAFGESAHAEGESTLANGEAAHAEGLRTFALGSLSHAEGYSGIAYGDNSHSEGSMGFDTRRITGQAGATKYEMDVSFDNDITLGVVFCYNTNEYAIIQLISGLQITLDRTLSADKPLENVLIYIYTNGAFGEASHAEGYRTLASGHRSHAEGIFTKALGRNSHSEGESTVASSISSHAEGCSTHAVGEYQHVQGKYNVSDTESAHIVGNGTSDTSRSNAHTLDWNGTAWYAGDVYVGSNSGINKDEGSKKLATEEYVVEQPKPYVYLTDSVNGKTYKLEMQDGTLISQEVAQNE